MISHFQGMVWVCMAFIDNRAMPCINDYALSGLVLDVCGVH
jgi:hypothetical protein